MLLTSVCDVPAKEIAVTSSTLDGINDTDFSIGWRDFLN